VFLSRLRHQLDHSFRVDPDGDGIRYSARTGKKPWRKRAAGFSPAREKGTDVQRHRECSLSGEQRGKFPRGCNPRALMLGEGEQTTLVAGDEIIDPAGFLQGQQKIIGRIW
jgi:hypothetical protein